jgi:virginiamycin B lyase
MVRTRKSNCVGRITMDGVVTEFAHPTATANPGRLVTGPDGNIWFNEWFGQMEGNSIGRLNIHPPDDRRLKCAPPS